MKVALLFLLLILCVVAAVGIFHFRKSVPSGLNERGPVRFLSPESVKFYADITAERSGGERWVSQEIFETVLQQIRSADRFIVADFFLINEFAGGPPEGVEKDDSLSSRFVEALVEAKRASPAMPVILITDPLNTLYGGIDQPLFEKLDQSGVEVVLTDLRQLRDSNLAYSAFWRAFFGWWGSPRGQLVKNPLGEGRIGLHAFLEMLNFKANHRKLLIIGMNEGDTFGLVTSANPHSASSLHGNVALEFSGPLAVDLLRSEEAVYRMSTGEDFPLEIQKVLKTETIDEVKDEESLEAKIITEKAIKRELLDQIGGLGKGDELDLALFYFSDFELKRALVEAEERGATVRLLLDPSEDAFGRKKNGIPNRQVAQWLVQRGVEVRWFRTSGEQFHTKMALFRYGGNRATLILGSANWTRRNLDNYNLETNVSLSGPISSPVFVEAGDYFSFVWGDDSRQGSEGVPSDLVTSLSFDKYHDPSAFRKVLYWIMERTGASTF
ncbi:MAG: phospholipase D-like domain-containing protein [Verrucomicrobiota bacterium]